MIEILPIGQRTIVVGGWGRGALRDVIKRRLTLSGETATAGWVVGVGISICLTDAPRGLTAAPALYATSITAGEGKSFPDGFSVRTSTTGASTFAFPAGVIGSGWGGLIN
ncbi:MAG: hypothetical protein R3C68_07140 [Myxococcota bacterium]